MLSSATLQKDISFLQQMFEARLSAFSRQEDICEKIDFEVPVKGQSVYDDLLLLLPFFNDERLVLLLALTPHLKPYLIEQAIFKIFPQGGEIPEIGGVKGTNYRGMLPTGETAAFLIAAGNWQKRVKVQALFADDHFFAQENIISLEAVATGEPVLSGKIILSVDYLQLLTSGAKAKPKFSPDFPAKLLETKMDWDDLVLPPATFRQINDIKIWLDQHKKLREHWHLATKIKPGYKSLFYGSPGTGKTLTASLLGKHFNKDVYRIDLSQVVSKFIGETEKNLEKVFQKAENQDWILFFDEADALFGKRSSVQSAHDKFANQETSYLLQRVEDFNGLVILASNFKNNIDNAFVRRFNSIVHFPQPGLEDRKLLWKKALPEKWKTDFETGELAVKYELTGSAIINVVYFAALRAMAEQSSCLKLKDVLEGIKNEFHKEDKFFEKYPIS